MAREPNARLADVMRRAGCSNTNLALRVQRVASEHGADLKCTHVDVGRWLNGGASQAGHRAVHRDRPEPQGRDADLSRRHRHGQHDDLAALEEGLDYAADAPAAGSRLLGLTCRELAGDALALGAGIVPAAWPQPMLSWLLARPEPLPAHRGGRVRVGESDVQAIRTTVQLFMQMDFQFGGGHARAALAQYFANDVCPLLDGAYTDQAGRRLFSAAAQVAELLGFTAYDIGRHGLAQRYFIQGLRLAQAAGDRMMGGRLLASMRHQANYLGRCDQAVQLARAAQEGARPGDRDHHGDVLGHGSARARRERRWVWLRSSEEGRA